MSHDNGQAIPKPGKKGGPCRNVCLHEACDAQRRIAECSACCLCAGAIGYNERFLTKSEDVGDGLTRETYCHELCAAKATIFNPDAHPIT